MANRPRKVKPKHAVFEVDTRLFRELGSLLVGRDATALMELVKNAYDADATYVRVEGTNLRAPTGFIKIEDDGGGMSEAEFRSGFLRIAGRSKIERGRLSRIYRRQYTGAKGIGRLAAHKLAALLDVKSQPEEGAGIDATIDWNRLERHRNLSTAGNAIEIVPYRRRSAGTTIMLRKLRKVWTGTDIADFSTTATSFTPNDLFTKPLPKKVVAGKVLFDRPVVRRTRAGDPGMTIQLEGDFAVGETYWKLLANEIQWIVEIRARADGVHLVVSPSVLTKRENANAASQPYREDHPDPKNGPFFDARIFVRVGRPANETVRDFNKRNAGIRVFLEGFRVPPYGEPGNDWLGLVSEYAERTQKTPSISYFADEADTIDAGLSRFAPSALYGAVFLTEQGAPEFETLVNREGFVPGPGLELLRKMCRDAVYAAVRVRALAERRKSPPQSSGAGHPRPSRVGSFASAPYVRGVLNAALQEVGKTRERIVELDGDAAPLTVLETRQRRAFDRLVDNLAADFEILRVLAGIGLQLSVFTHEINGALAGIRNVEKILRAQSAEKSPQGVASAVREALTVLDEVRRSLERQASYLVDARLPDIRRRRRRQAIAASYRSVKRLFAGTIKRYDINLDDDNVDTGVQSPSMFEAELRTVLSNLMSNAIKAAIEDERRRRIRVRIAPDGDGALVRIENTGSKVDLRDSERLFEAFVTTSAKADPTLGRGMGLGLPIASAILDVYNSSIRFVRPSPGFKTAIEVRLSS